MESPNQQQRTAKELWMDYSFLTREMNKCIRRRDLNLFEEIMMQREELQTIIDNLHGEDETFIRSTEGQAFLREIVKENEETRQSLQQYKNTANKQVAVARSYENAGMTYVGRRMDSQR